MPSSPVTYRYEDEDLGVIVAIQPTIPRFYVHSKTRNRSNWRRKMMVIGLGGYWDFDRRGAAFAHLKYQYGTEVATSVWNMMHNSFLAWCDEVDWYSQSAQDYWEREIGYGTEIMDLESLRTGIFWIYPEEIDAWTTCSIRNCSEEEWRIIDRIGSQCCEEHQRQIDEGELIRCDVCHHFMAPDESRQIQIRGNRGPNSMHADCALRSYSRCEDSLEAAGIDASYTRNPDGPWTLDFHWRPNQRDCSCNNIINGYSYKPEPIFHPELPPSAKALYIGMELETEFGTMTMTAFKYWYRKQDRTLYYVKTDSSISNGYEIVTHPFTPEWGMERDWSEWSELISLGAKPQGPSTGQHIHMNKDAFDSAHLWKILQFHNRLPDFCQLVGGRDSRRWGSFEVVRQMQPEITKIAKEKAKGSYGYARGSAVNLHPTHTIELRYPAGDIRPDSIRKNIQWIWALYHFTDEITPALISKGALDTPGMFIYWLEQNKEQLPDLHRWVAARVLQPVAFEVPTRTKGPREGVLPGGNVRPTQPRRRLEPQAPGGVTPPSPWWSYLRRSVAAAVDFWLDPNDETWFVRDRHVNNGRPDCVFHLDSGYSFEPTADGAPIYGFNAEYDTATYRSFPDGSEFTWEENPDFCGDPYCDTCDDDEYRRYYL